MKNLSLSDYKHILDYYKIAIPSSKIKIKKMAEQLLADKLCRCIKKLEPMDESKAIGICTKTIINNKGFMRGTFQCKTKSIVKLYKKARGKQTLKNKKAYK